MPIVYILTNEAMPDMVKIGHTSDDKLAARIKGLDNTSVPLPFECFFAWQVKNARRIERQLHQGLDDFKVRNRREFFRIEPERVRDLLTIAEGKEVTPNEPIVKEPQDAQALKAAHELNQAFHFGMLGIEKGEKLQFKKDISIECEVYDNRRVLFREEIMSLSAAADIALRELGYNWVAVQGPAFWCWQGDTLHNHRRARY